MDESDQEFRIDFYLEPDDPDEDSEHLLGYYAKAVPPFQVGQVVWLEKENIGVYQPYHVDEPMDLGRYKITEIEHVALGYYGPSILYSVGVVLRVKKKESGS